MATSAGLAYRAQRPRPGFWLALLLGGAAIAVGAFATVQPLAAIAVVVGAAILLVVAADVDALPVFLVFTMFVSSLSLGPGLAIGRVAGPMALVVLALYVLEKGKNDLRPNALLALVFIYGLWTLLSVYWAADSRLVYSEFFSYLIAVAYMLVFAILVRRTGQVLAVFATLAIGSLLFGVAAFAAFYTSSAGERSAGLVGDPNFFAVYQVLALPPTLVLAAREPRPGRRLAYLGIVGVIILSVVSSLSRTGLVALTAVVLATLILPWRVFFQRPGQKVTYFLMLVVASGVAVAAGSASVIARAQSILDPGSAAGDRGAGRLDLWRAALRGWHEHPWVGLGASNFQAHALDLLQTTPGVNTRASYVHAGREVHNAYLEELSGLGVIGLALFALVILAAGWYLLVAFRRARAGREPLLERLSLAMLVSLLGFALSAIFLSSQLSRALWILVGLALALDVMTRRLVAAVEGGAAPSYDLPVGGPVEEPEPTGRAVQMEDVVAAEQRLDRRRLALTEREQELEARIREFEALERQRAEVAQKIARGTAEVASQRRALAQEQERAQERLAEAEAQLAAVQARVGDLEERAQSLETGTRELELLKGQQERLAAELAEREQTIETTSAELAQRESEMRELLEREQAEIDERLAGAQEALEQQRGEVERERRGVAEQREAIAEQRNALEGEWRRQREEQQAALEREQAEVRERLAAERAALEQELAEWRGEVERTLARREQGVAEREEALAARRHELELLAASATRTPPPPTAGIPEPPSPEPLPPVPEPRPPEPVPEPPVPPPVPASPARAAPALAPSAGRWNLDVLEHLVVKHGAGFPERAQEWSYYLIYLRDFADLDNTLPDSFEGLVLDVFGPLIELERRG